MCARIFLSVTDEELAEFLELDDLPPFAPRYNVAPGQDVLVVRGEGAGRPRPALLRWGLVPHFSSGTDGARFINARSESAARRSAFKESFQQRRCLIPAAGFYEWKKDGERRRPFAIRSRAGLVGLGGLWDRWEHDGRVLETFTVLTTAADGALAEIHDRMPVVLERAQFPLWLDPGQRESEGLAKLLRPYPADRLVVQPVGSRVNKADFDDPACLEPDSAPFPSQGRLF